jgi:hypothetical protein
MTEYAPNTFQEIQNTLHTRPTSMAQDMDNLKTEARRLRDSWSKSKVDEDEHSHN